MALESLEPRSVFHYFEALSAIPHGSGNTRAISDYCVRFAAERGLEHYQDASNNVIIIAPATAGYEDAEPLILQGHLDMVCAAAADCGVDMRTEGLSLFIDGDFIGAKGTSLGGDDGIAIAMILALLDDNSIPHPRIEAVFTTDEETGMLGAMALDVSPLRGHTMLNLDSEEEAVFTVACAGGARVEINWVMEQENITAVPLTLTISGLVGGHSGTEIDKGRGNANILMGRLLRVLSKCCSLRLISLAGGTADNVIPNSCVAEVAVSRNDVDTALSVTKSLNQVFQDEFSFGDKNISVSAAVGSESELSVLGAEDTRHLLNALALVPNGVQAMNHALPGFPETSLNLGILTLTGTKASMLFLIRSSVDSRIRKLTDRLYCVAEVCGGVAATLNEYPAWEFKSDSPLRDRMVHIFREQYGYEPKVTAIHAGLECGILANKIPGLDCVSIGPDIPDIHTCAERMGISSVQRLWAFLLEVLKQSK